MLIYEFAVIIGIRANTIATIASKEFPSVSDGVINRKAFRAYIISTTAESQTAIGMGFKEGDTSPRPNAHAVAVGLVIFLFVRTEVCNYPLSYPPSLANELCSVGSRAAELTYALATVIAVEYLKLKEFYLFHNL